MDGFPDCQAKTAARHRGGAAARQGGTEGRYGGAWRPDDGRRTRERRDGGREVGRGPERTQVFLKMPDDDMDFQPSMNRLKQISDSSFRGIGPLGSCQYMIELYMPKMK